MQGKREVWKLDERKNYTGPGHINASGKPWNPWYTRLLRAAGGHSFKGYATTTSVMLLVGLGLNSVIYNLTHYSTPKTLSPKWIEAQKEYKKFQMQDPIKNNYRPWEEK